MDKSWMLLSLCLVALCAYSSVKAESVETSQEDWEDIDDGWYDEELEKLGIKGMDDYENYDDDVIPAPEGTAVENNDHSKENKETGANFDTDFSNVVENNNAQQNDLNNVKIDKNIEDADNMSDQKDDSNENGEVDFKVKEEIDNFLNESKSVVFNQDDSFDDYQVEDNRSAGNIGNESHVILDNQEEVDSVPSINEEKEDNNILNQNKNLSDDNLTKNLEDEVEPIEEPALEDVNRDIIQQTRDILDHQDEIDEKNIDNSQEPVKLSKDDNSSSQKDEDKVIEKKDGSRKVEIDEQILKDINTDNIENEENKIIAEKQNINISDLSNDKTPVESIDVKQEELKNVLAESGKKFEINDEYNGPEEQKEIGDEDTVDEVYEDLKNDFDKLLETMDKLAEDSDSSPEDDDEKVYDEEENIADYEEEHKRPYKEGIVLQQRQDYDESLNQLFKDDNDVKNSEEFDYESEEENADDSVKPVPYVNDALLDKSEESEQNAGENNLEIDINIEVDNNDEAKSKKPLDSDVINPHPIEPLSEKELSSAELNDLMTQLALEHVDDLDVNSEDFDKNVAPVNIHLKLGETKVIESPGYPGPYPTNNIIDWRIDGVGEGIGIEMNITDFAINGNLGDYLLVKPGGVDESGQDGLVFSYTLRSVRRYRFLDLDRMFIRFEAMPGASQPTSRGFQITLKLVSATPEEMEPVPQPEPVAELPTHRLLVYLGGLTVDQFRNVSEDFRLIVADMATMFVNRHGIEAGEINMEEVTQITNVSTCNINWPGFEYCTGVRFGVPLGIEGDEDHRLTTEDLDLMWKMYVDTDPFAARLKRLGVTMFAVPNDSTTLMVWLVIGFGVVISASMLALALWRWSCLEDYTRMNAYSETESVISDGKRDLDLYPTPHQTLPPLYDDDFIKYEDNARADLGGFNNRGYSRAAGDLYDLESDDDVTALPPGPQRDRFTTDV